MHPMLLTVLIIMVTLVGLSLAALRIRTLGYAIALVWSVLGRLLVKLTACLEKAAADCHTISHSSLRPAAGAREYWVGITVLSRLVYLVLSVCILGGEAVNTLLASPTLFQAATHIKLPSVADLASAGLFLAIPALFGAVLLECWGLIPQEAGLFPRLGPISRWILGVCSGIFLVLSILLAGYVYLFRAAYLIDPASTQGMSLVILGVLGLLLAVASVIAFWALVVGMTGVISLLSWIIWLIFRLLHATLSLVQPLLEMLVVHFSQGRLSIYQEFTPPGAYHVPSLTFSASTQAPFQQDALADRDEIIPVQITLEEPMHHADKNAALVFIGPFGSRMLSPMGEKMTALRAAGVILTSGHLDLARAELHQTLPGTVSITPDQGTRNTALLHGQTETKAYQTLLSHMGEQLVETHLKTKASPAPLLFFLDPCVLSTASGMLQTVKRRLPLHPLAVVTSLSAQDAEHKDVRRGLTDLYALHAQDLLETTLVIDPRSPFAGQHGEETQLQFLSHFLVSLLIAHTHSSQNLSGSQALQIMHSLSPFATVSFASEAVAVGTMPGRWAWLPGVEQQAGMGTYNDILTQTRSAIDKTITLEATHSFAAPVGAEAPCMVFCSEPLALKDPRFTRAVQDTARYVGTTYPYAKAVTTRGNGCPYPNPLRGRYRVNATCLYPLHPEAFAHHQARKQLPAATTFPAVSPISPSNGHYPGHPEPAQTPDPVTIPPQQNPVIPARRGRKPKAEK